MLHIHSVYATYAPPLIRMRETRKTYKICSRHTIRNLRNAPVQLSWERNLQMAATFPSSSPGNTRPIPLLPNILTTLSQESTTAQYTHKLTTTARYILTSYPGTTKYIYCCPIYPPSPLVYRCSRINQGRGMLKQNILYQALTTQSADSEDPAV